jgi:hypothetical protein
MEVALCYALTRENRNLNGLWDCLKREETERVDVGHGMSTHRDVVGNSRDKRVSEEDSSAFMHSAQVPDVVKCKPSETGRMQTAERRHCT